MTLEASESSSYWPNQFQPFSGKSPCWFRIGGTIDRMFQLLNDDNRMTACSICLEARRGRLRYE